MQKKNQNIMRVEVSCQGVVKRNGSQDAFKSISLSTVSMYFENVCFDNATQS